MAMNLQRAAVIAALTLAVAGVVLLVHGVFRAPLITGGISCLGVAVWIVGLIALNDEVSA